MPRFTKIYEVTINSLDCNGIVDNSATWSFLNVEDRDNFLDYLDTLTIEDNFEVDEDEYYLNTFENAKKEARDFLGLDGDDNE